MLCGSLFYGLSKEKRYLHLDPIANLNDNLSDYIEAKPPDKIFNKWEQSTVEAEHVIKKLTLENQTILDPWMDSGTTGLAAINLGRKFIGIEKDQEKFAIAKKRLENNINKQNVSNQSSESSTTTTVVDNQQSTVLKEDRW